MVTMLDILLYHNHSWRGGRVGVTGNHKVAATTDGFHKSNVTV